MVTPGESAVFGSIHSSHYSSPVCGSMHVYLSAGLVAERGDVKFFLTCPAYVYMLYVHVW